MADSENIMPMQRAGKRPNRTPSHASSTIDVTSWLSDICSREDFAALSLKGVDGAALLKCRTAQAAATLLKTDAVLAARILAELGTSGRRRARRANGQAWVTDVKPDVADLNARWRDAGPNTGVKEEVVVKRELPDNDDSDGASDDDAEDGDDPSEFQAVDDSMEDDSAPPNGHAAVAQAQAQEDDVEAQGDENAFAGADAAEAATQQLGADDDAWDGSSDEEGQEDGHEGGVSTMDVDVAMASDDDSDLEGAEAGADAEGAMRFKAAERVVLPDGALEQRRYMQRAIMGFSLFMHDILGASTSYFKKTFQLLGRNPANNVRKDSARLTKLAWQRLEQKLAQALDKGRDDLEGALTDLKVHLHALLSKKYVQKLKLAYSSLTRLIPCGVIVQQEQAAADDSDDRVILEVARLNMDEDFVETVWQLWQAQPCLGSFSVPVTAGKRGFDKDFDKVQVLGQQHTRELLGLYTEHGASRNKASARVQTDTAEDVAQVLEALKQLVQARSQAPNKGCLVPLVSICQEPESAAETGDCVLDVQLFLEAGMVSTNMQDGMSGFAQMDGGGAVQHIPLCLLHATQYQGTELHSKLEASQAAAETLYARMRAVDIDSPHEPLNGTLFPKLIAMVSDTVQEVPDGLEDEVAAHLTVTPTPYQLASIAFLQREEAALGGVQRHLWWPLPLPEGQQGVCFVSPHFNAVWWASEAKHLEYWDAVANRAHDAPAVRRSNGFRFYEQRPRGGMLALEMGLGKTLVVMVAHALEQHTLPEEPECLTVHTPEALELTETVQIGQDEDRLKDATLHTGFKVVQAPQRPDGRDGARTIVPDGTLRYVALGNLVVVPATLAMQWKQEIRRLCSQPQKIVVLDGIAERRHFMTSREGLRELATYDWVITTPAKLVKDIDLIRALDWRRVIADEAHQLQAAVASARGLSTLVRDAALMKLLAGLTATRGYWCLTGTPLKNYKQVQSMDRILGFLSTGVDTKAHLNNLQFVTLVSDIAIRFTKAGNFQGEQCLELPPITEHIRQVELSDEDRTCYTWAVQALVGSSGVPRARILELQANEAADGAAAGGGGARRYESDDDWEDTSARKAAKAVVVKSDVFKMLTGIVDPLRRALSAAVELYLPGTGNDVKADAEHLHVGKPADLKRPKRRKDEEPLTAQEWREIYDERRSHWTELYISSKVETVINDITAIMDEAANKEEEGLPVKVIIYSNFCEAFKRVREHLVGQNIRFSSLSGAMSMKKRAAALDDFRNDDDVPIFLLNKQCGAMGINLTCATHVLIMETSWNPVWEDQAISRANRLGQQGPIDVYRYITTDTVESRLRDLMQHVHNQDNGTEEELVLAVAGKEAFESDEKALNALVAKVFRDHEIAGLIGSLDDSDEEDESEEDEE